MAEEDSLTSDTAYGIVEGIRPAQAVLRDLAKTLSGLGVPHGVDLVRERLDEAASTVAKVRLGQPVEHNPQTRLIDAFHERTGRCLGNHLDCARVEQRHGEGNHGECLPTEDGWEPCLAVTKTPDHLVARCSLRAGHADPHLTDGNVAFSEPVGTLNLQAERALLDRAVLNLKSLRGVLPGEMPRYDYAAVERALEALDKVLARWQR